MLGLPTLLWSDFLKYLNCNFTIHELTYSVHSIWTINFCLFSGLNNDQINIADSLLLFQIWWEL